MTRSQGIASERPHRSPRSTPSWLISLGLHALLCAFCVFGLDRVGGGHLKSGQGGRSLQLIASFGTSTIVGPPGTGLDDAAPQQGADRPAGSKADVEIIPPVAPQQPDGPANEPAEPMPIPEAAVAEEGLAVPEQVANASQVRSIQRKYSQLLQGEASDSEGAGEMSGMRSGNGGAGSGKAIGNGGGGAGTGTSFFEVNGQGNLFCYVVDCSSSMEEENSIGVARAELLASLQQLDSKQRFQILFYDSELHPMLNGRQDTFFATDAHRRFARQFVASQQPNSGTIHKPALLAALKMAPDVIFFLTDGDTPELSFRDLWDIKQANRKRAQIHVIEFGKGAKLGSLDWLEQLARDHRGSYHYQDVTAWRNP